MLKSISNQRRGDASLIIIIVLAMVIIGGIAWYTLAPKTTNTSSEATASPAATASTTATPVVSTSENYLKVPELGVKMKLTSDILDLSYKYDATKSTTWVTLSSAKMIAEASNCTDSGHLTKVPVAEKGDNPTGGLVSGDSYYFVALPNGECSTTASGSALDMKIRNALKDAVIEKL